MSVVRPKRWLFDKVVIVFVKRVKPVLSCIYLVSHPFVLFHNLFLSSALFPRLSGLSVLFQARFHLPFPCKKFKSIIT